MSFGLRLSLLLLISGCAETVLVVPDSDWRTVPAPQREAIDRQHDGELTAARAELAAASTSLAAFQQAPAAARTTSARSSEPADPGDVYATVARDHERARTDALARVETAAAQKQRTDLAWRRLRVDAAGARLDMVVSKRELTRAHAIDRNMPGSDTYDTAPLRGQFSRIQQRWYTISTRAREARDAFERASASLASAKEAYAQLMRNGPIRLVEPPADADDHSARLELTAWSIMRSDIRRRRGLRHFLDETSANPQLRKLTLQLNPALHATPALQAANASTPAPLVTPGASSPPADPGRGTPPAMATRAAEQTGRSASPAAAPAGRPDARRSASPAVIDHPADRASTASTAAAASAKSAGPRNPSPALRATDHPADRAGDRSPTTTAVSTKPGPPGSIPSTTSPPISGKPAESHTTSPAATAKSTDPTATPARAPVPAAKGGGAARGAPAPGGATRAAKPVERPAESDTRAR